MASLLADSHRKVVDVLCRTVSQKLIRLGDFGTTVPASACDQREDMSMLDELGRLITDCWRSRLGRAFFLIHLLVCMTLVGYAWSNFSSPFIPGIRKLCFVLNWFSIFQLESHFMVFGRPSASRFTDGVSTFLFSIP